MSSVGLIEVRLDWVELCCFTVCCVDLYLFTLGWVGFVDIGLSLVSLRSLKLGRVVVG